MLVKAECVHAKTETKSVLFPVFRSASVPETGSDTERELYLMSTIFCTFPASLYNPAKSRYLINYVSYNNEFKTCPPLFMSKLGVAIKLVRVFGLHLMKRHHILLSLCKMI